MCDVGKADISENCCGTGVASMGLMKRGKHIATIFTLRRQLDQFGGNHIIYNLGAQTTCEIANRCGISK